MLRIVINLAITAGLLGSMCACTYVHVSPGWARSGDSLMEPPPGPPEYQQGFLDGCESGFSGYGNSFNKLFWTWKQDPQLAENNPVYYQIWKDAYTYCANWSMITDEHGLGNWR